MRGCLEGVLSVESKCVGAVGYERVSRGCFQCRE